MGVGKFLKRQMAGLMSAMSAVEKNALGQEANDLGQNVNQIQRHKQGMLSDALTRGEITQEVKDLRWRMYKIVQASKGNIAKIVGYKEPDENGYEEPIVEVISTDPTKGLDKVTVDKVDKYPVELVFDNSEVSQGGNEVIDLAKDYDDTKERYDVDGYGDSDYEDSETMDRKTIGEISIEDFESRMNFVRPLKVFRELRTKFAIEDFTKKLIVRKISNGSKLLEFYISKYPDENNRKSYLFISEIKKAMDNPRKCDSLDIQEVGFITDKTIGVEDYREFQYNNISFDKIVDFNGHYVVKFKADVLVDGKNILDGFIEADLEERYRNKEAKN
jgi:hypothetical protein